MALPPKEAAATATAQVSYSTGRSEKFTARPLSHATIVSSVIGKYIAPLVIMVVDYIAVVLALIASSYLRSTIIPAVFSGVNPFGVKSAYIFYVIPLFYSAFLAYDGMYSKRLPFWQEAGYLCKISAYVAGLIAIIVFFTGDVTQVSQIFTLMTWILSFIFLATCRYYLKRALSLSGLWHKPVVIVGAGETAEAMAQSFANDPYIGYTIVGLIEDDYHERSLIQRQRLPQLGSIAQAEQAILSSGVEDVIVVASGFEREKLIDIVYRIQPYTENLSVVPDLFGFPIGNISVETLFNEKVVLLKTKNQLMSLPNKIIKRIFDAILAVTILPAILPIAFVIAVLIKFE